MRPATTLHWNVFGCSVQGAMHLRHGAPNQDAIDWLATYGSARPLVALVLSDGHGGARYVRSAVGAQIAVQVGRTLLGQLGEEYYRTGDLAAIKQLTEHQLPAQLVRGWQHEVDVHLTDRPLSAEELAPLTDEARTSVQRQPRLAYGATLVATLATAGFLLYLQLGDGDIVTVDGDGRAGRPPLPVDPRTFGDATTSLCMADGWRYVRSYLQPLAAHPPALVLLATDGYANSFVTDTGFLLAAEDIYALLAGQPRDAVGTLRTHLPQWLRATSDQGSGDDITVGVLFQTP